jgi:hypothetical protein
MIALLVVLVFLLIAGIALLFVSSKVWEDRHPSDQIVLSPGPNQGPSAPGKRASRTKRGLSGQDLKACLNEHRLDLVKSGYTEIWVV